MPSSQPPEVRIREYLEETGPAEVSLEALVSTWRDSRDRKPNLAKVARLLRDEGIYTTPELTDAEPATMIELSLEPPPEPEPEPEPEPLPEPQRRRSRSLLNPQREPAAPPPPRRGLDPEPDADAEPAAALAPGEAAEAARIVLGIGAVALIASLFLPWFDASQAGVDIPGLGTAWQWYGSLDVYLTLVGIGGTALLVAGDARRLLSAVVLGGAAIALLCVAYQITNPPSPSGAREIAEVSRGVGPFVSLVALLAVGAGAWIAGARELVEGSREAAPDAAEGAPAA